MKDELVRFKRTELPITEHGKNLDWSRRFREVSHILQPNDSIIKRVRCYYATPECTFTHTYYSKEERIHPTPAQLIAFKKHIHGNEVSK